MNNKRSHNVMNTQFNRNRNRMDEEHDDFDVQEIKEPDTFKKMKGMSGLIKESHTQNHNSHQNKTSTQQHNSKQNEMSQEKTSFQIDNIPVNSQYLNRQNRFQNVNKGNEDCIIKFDEEGFNLPIKKDDVKQNKDVIQIDEIVPLIKRKHIHYDFNEPIVKDQPLLPVHEKDKMKEIKDTIRNNNVIVISGNTGCGKSTQIPKFIACEDTSSKIIVTQPRRVAAIALAQRVSEELRSELGKRVGYQIGQDSKFNKNTQILYVTIGIFLQKLVNDPDNFLKEYTHIILDEVHERGIESDFGLIALKTFLSLKKNRSSIKLLVMSATLNKDIFLNYFSTEELNSLENEIKEDQNSKESFFDSSKFQQPLGVNKECKDYDHKDWIQQGQCTDVWMQSQNQDEMYEKMLSMVCRFNKKYESKIKNYVEITVKQLYQVKTIYLDSINECKKFCNKNYFNARKPELNEDLYRITANELKRIIFNEEESLKEYIKGDILVFLPGYNEIMKMRQAFEQLMANVKPTYQSKMASNPYKVMELHSCLGDINTKELLEKQRYTKIILATNIAESSITIPDCFVVIDFCLTKEINYNPSNGIERLELSWSSKASITQRAGRTGRNCKGVNLRLIPERFFQAEIRDYQIPEILRCPIEKVILKIKILDEGESEYQKIHIGENEVEQNNLIEEIIKDNEDEKIKKKSLKFPNEIEYMDEKNHYETKIIDDVTILNDKVFKKKVKSNNYQDKLRLFEDPVRVLKRAIESPDDYGICQSMENLIAVGALKFKKVQYSKEEQSKIKVRVTRLGRFYNEIPCDIKLAKFICFGYFFNCLIECISIASIYSQRKSFFVPFQRFSHDIKQVDNFTDMIFRYDNGQESDMFLELKLFQEWEKIFFLPSLQRIQQRRSQRNNNNNNKRTNDNSSMNQQPYMNEFKQTKILVDDDDELTLTQKLEFIKKQAESNNNKDSSTQYKPIISYAEDVPEVESEDKLLAGVIDRMTINTFKSERIQKQEYQWCDEHFCDPKILREILSTREDFKMRIPKEAGVVSNIFEFQDLDDENHIMKIKFCLAGAFNRYTLKSDIFDIKEMQKIRQYLLVEQMDPFCTLIIENTLYAFQCLGIHEKEIIIQKIKQGINQFCTIKERAIITHQSHDQSVKDYVAKIKLKYSSIYIEFIKTKQLPIILKEMMTMKKRFFNHTKLNDKDSQVKEIPATVLLNIKSNSIDFDKYFIKGQNTFKYAYEAKLNLTNLKFTRLVSLESDSINLITLGDYNRHKYLVASDLMVRGHRIVAQGITVMPPNYPLFLAIASLIFGSQCYVNCDKEGKKYESINVDNSEIELDHYLLDIDIKEVNDIRRELRACLDEDSFFNDQANIHLDLWNKVRQKLLSRVAMRHVDYEKWEDIFSRDYLSGNFEVEAEIQKKMKVMKILDSIRTNKNEEMQKQIEAENPNLSLQQGQRPKKNLKLLFQNQKRKTIQDRTTHASEKGFMNQIFLTKKSETNLVTLSQQDNIDLLQEYFENYNLWKQKKIRELKHFYLLHTIQEPHIVCKHCYQELYFQVPLFKASKLTNMLDKVKQINFNGFTDNLYLKDMQITDGKIIEIVYTTNQLINKNDKSMTQNQEFIDRLDEILNPLKNFGYQSSQSQIQIETLRFYACQNGHIIGFTNEDNQLYNNMKIPDCSQLLFLYSDLDYIQFTSDTFSEFDNSIQTDQKEEENQERQEKKAELLLNLNQMGCIICDCLMTDTAKMDEEIKLQDQGIDTSDWRVKLEKHIKTEQHKLNEEIFLRSTRSPNYFFTK